jgi:hypothetical protein
MSKLKQMKTKLFIAIGCIVLISVVAIMGGVKAYQNYSQDAPKQVCEAGATCNYSEAQTPQAPQALGLSNSDYDESYTNLTKLSANTFRADTSYDGFIVYKAMTVATTSTQDLLYNNTGVDMMCNGSDISVYGQGSTTVATLDFTPSLYLVMGTASTSLAYSANLVASTTLATSTNQIVTSTNIKPFLIKNGEYITARLGDINNNASSTYFSSWSIKAMLPCTLIGDK